MFVNKKIDNNADKIEQLISKAIKEEDLELIETIAQSDEKAQKIFEGLISKAIEKNDLEVIKIIAQSGEEVQKIFKGVISKFVEDNGEDQITVCLEEAEKLQEHFITVCLEEAEKLQKDFNVKNILIELQQIIDMDKIISIFRSEVALAFGGKIGKTLNNVDIRQGIDQAVTAAKNKGLIITIEDIDGILEDIANIDAKLFTKICTLDPKLFTKICTQLKRGNDKISKDPKNTDGSPAGCLFKPETTTDSNRSSIISI
jgi:hypothetical protein